MLLISNSYSPRSLSESSVFFSDFFVHFDWSKSKDEAGFADGFTSDEFFIPGTAKSEKLPVFYMSCSFVMLSINAILI